LTCSVCFDLNVAEQLEEEEPVACQFLRILAPIFAAVKSYKSSCLVSNYFAHSDNL